MLKTASLRPHQPFQTGAAGHLPAPKLPLLFFVVGSLLLSSCANMDDAPAQGDEPFLNTVVSLTFDDGDADNFAIRSALMDNDLRATWYIASGLTGTPGYLTQDQLRTLRQDGHEIGGHSLDHINLTEVRGVELRRQVCQDRLNLLTWGFEPVSFAYPFGHYDQESARTVSECGYNSARIVTGGPDTNPPADALAVKAMPYIVSNVRLAKMQRYVTEVAAAGGGWVIFVFHHICEDCDQYSIDLETFTAFADWLGDQQSHGLVVATIGDIVGGAVQPAVEP